MKFENFSQPARQVVNRRSQFDRFQLKFIMGRYSNSERPIMFSSYLPHLDSESCIVYFFWIPYSLRSVLTKFEIFSQPN